MTDQPTPPAGDQHPPAPDQAGAPADAVGAFEASLVVAGKATPSDTADPTVSLACTMGWQDCQAVPPAAAPPYRAPRRRPARPRLARRRPAARDLRRPGPGGALPAHDHDPESRACATHSSLARIPSRAIEQLEPSRGGPP